eukprot:GHRR01032525.1.p1 GENE.GHRR01032525.1~~GHRR01032525.1.p1  ORF type:complete len:104 (-),score=19.11 GHRR01032525.1:102-413(-)
MGGSLLATAPHSPDNANAQPMTQQNVDANAETGDRLLEAMVSQHNSFKFDTNCVATHCCSERHKLYRHSFSSHTTSHFWIQLLYITLIHPGFLQQVLNWLTSG